MESAEDQRSVVDVDVAYMFIFTVVRGVSAEPWTRLGTLIHILQLPVQQNHVHPYPYPYP